MNISYIFVEPKTTTLRQKTTTMNFNLPTPEQTAKRLQYLNSVTMAAKTKSIKADIAWYERNAKSNEVVDPSWSKHCLEMVESLKIKLANVY